MSGSGERAGRHGQVKRGLTLTLVLWDPERRSAALREQAVSAAGRTRLPTSVETGAEDGLVQVHMWAGSVGLGLPTDRPEDWATLGSALGRIVEQVRPALALSAPEWSVGSLTHPDPEQLRPGLACGWCRLGGLDLERVTKFVTLEQRSVVHRRWDGFAWAATGVIALDGVNAGTVERVSEAVRRAWFAHEPTVDAGATE